MRERRDVESREAGLWTDGNPSVLGMARLPYYAARDRGADGPRFETDVYVYAVYQCTSAQALPGR